MGGRRWLRKLCLLEGFVLADALLFSKISLHDLCIRLQSLQPPEYHWQYQYPFMSLTPNRRDISTYSAPQPA